MHILPTTSANVLTPADEHAIRAWAAPRSIEVEQDQTERGETFFALQPTEGFIADALADLHLTQHEGHVVAVSGCEEIANGRTVAEALANLEAQLPRWEAALAA